MLTKRCSSGLEATKRTTFGFGLSVATRREHWCRAASPSQPHVTRRRPLAHRFDLDVAIGRCLQDGDQHGTGAIAFEPAKFLRRNDDDLVAPAHGDVLGSLAADAPLRPEGPSDRASCY